MAVCTLSEIIRHSNVGKYCLVSDIEGAEAGMILAKSEPTRANCELMIIELHDHGVHKEKRYGVEELAAKIQQRWRMSLVATNDRVFVFSRASGVAISKN